jgi:hypothetical protein
LYMETIVSFFFPTFFFIFFPFCPFWMHWFLTQGESW